MKNWRGLNRPVVQTDYLLPWKGEGEAEQREAQLRAAERVHREVHTGLRAEHGQRSAEEVGVEW